MVNHEDFAIALPLEVAAPPKLHVADPPDGRATKIRPAYDVT